MVALLVSTAASQAVSTSQTVPKNVESSLNTLVVGTLCKPQASFLVVLSNTIVLSTSELRFMDATTLKTE